MQDGTASGAGCGVRSPLVAPAGPLGLRIRLARATGDDAEPFVVVHEGRFARILVAETCGADGRALTRFALKLRRDDLAAHAAAGGLPSNEELDRQWQLERDESCRVRSPHVVQPVPVPDAMLQSPPVFYCRRIDRCFHPVCPATGAVLTVCRDDAVLQAAGLKPYASDTVRHLHPAGAVAGGTLWRAGAAAADGGPGGFRELVRAWAPLVQRGEPTTELPCQGCAHRAECYPDGAAADRALPAEQFLLAVSHGDVDAVALELATHGLELVVPRLGGGLSAADEGPSAWIAGADPWARVLEVLRLKLAAFTDVCRGVAAVHDSGRPHLGISPANVVAFELDAGSAVPSAWRWRFALTDLGGAIPVRVPGQGQSVETLWQPGREVSLDPVSSLFLTPLLRSLQGGTVTMPVSCRSLAQDGVARVAVDVHRAGVPAFVLPGDLLLVQLPDGGGVHSARVDEVNAKALVATVLGSVHAFESRLGTSFEARLSFARRSGPSADLYGLGMLLLRLLLVHDEQPLEEVAAAVERCLSRMAAEDAEGQDLAARWQQLLDGEDGEGRFAPWHVMQRRADRQALFDLQLRGGAALPSSIWQALLRLAGQLLLAPPVARADGAQPPGSPLPHVLQQLAAIERRLHVELFLRAARDEAIVGVCAERAVAVRAELAGDGAPPDDERPSRPRPGFVLGVGRVGEAGIHQHHFTQDRVTIGRREGENLLQLADPMVSSKHAVIELQDGDYVLFDRGSTNGTEVDGIRLPVEVPHPLDDGSVIHIRPFVLSFRRAESTAAATMTGASWSEQELLEQLAATYAERAAGSGADVRIALFAVLDRARQALGRRLLLIRLESIVRRLGATAVADPAAERDRQLADAALRAVQQLGRNLIGWQGPETPEQVQELLGRLQRFVETTSRWVEETLEWRRLLGRQLDLRATATGAGRLAPRSAAAVRAELLTPTGEGDSASADHFLARFFDDVIAILEGLLQGNRQVRRAVREQLDPERLVALAGREAKLGLLVQAAAGSALWKLYVDTFRELTDATEHEQELDRLLERAAERRGRRGD